MYAAAKKDSAHKEGLCSYFLYGSPVALPLCVIRNNEVLGLVSWTDVEVLQRINQLADVCRETFSEKENASPQVRMVGWKLPPQGSIKINIDGSSKGNPGLAGFGGLL